MPPRVRRKLQVTLDEVQQRGHGGPICETTQSAEWDQRRFAAPAHQQFTTLSGGGPALEASWSHPTAFARRRISQPWQRGSLGLGGRTIQNGKPVPNSRRMLEWLMTRENDSVTRLARSGWCGRSTRMAESHNDVRLSSHLGFVGFCTKRGIGGLPLATTGLTVCRFRASG